MEGVSIHKYPNPSLPVAFILQIISSCFPDFPNIDSFPLSRGQSRSWVFDTTFSQVFVVQRQRSAESWTLFTGFPFLLPFTVPASQCHSCWIHLACPQIHLLDLNSIPEAKQKIVGTSSPFLDLGHGHFPPWWPTVLTRLFYELLRRDSTRNTRYY